MTTLGRSSLTRFPLRPAPAENGARSSHRARRDERSRWIALIVRCAGMLMIVLDMTVVNVALPSIQSDLGYTPVGSRLGDQRVPEAHVLAALARRHQLTEDRLRRAAAARRAPGRSGTSSAGQEEGDALPFHEHGRFDRP